MEPNQKRSRLIEPLSLRDGNLKQRIKSSLKPALHDRTHMSLFRQQICVCSLSVQSWWHLKIVLLVRLIGNTSVKNNDRECVALVCFAKPLRAWKPFLQAGRNRHSVSSARENWEHGLVLRPKRRSAAWWSCHSSYGCRQVTMWLGEGAASYEIFVMAQLVWRPPAQFRSNSSRGRWLYRWWLSFS